MEGQGTLTSVDADCGGKLGGCGSGREQHERCWPDPCALRQPCAHGQVTNSGFFKLHVKTSVIVTV